MNELVFDRMACRGCGACVAACPLGLIALEEKRAKRHSADRCIECFHCVAACPHEAVDVSGFDHETIAADSPLLSRRSCRSYRAEPVDREILASIAAKADLAPRMSRPTARRFIFVMRPQSLSTLRDALAPKIHRAAAYFRLMLALPFLPRATRGRFRELFSIVKMTSKRINSGWDIFHGAPVIALVTGRKSEGMNKEDGLYAMQQLLLAAEAAGLGSCVSGFPSGFPEATAKALGLPKGETVWAAAMLGHPRQRFARVVIRRDLHIQWK